MHQQTTGSIDNSDLEVGFSAMKKTNNPLHKDFQAKMMEKLRNVVEKYSYSNKRTKVMDAEDEGSRNFGGNGTPIPSKWCNRTPNPQECRDSKLRAVLARQTQDLGYDLSVQWEFTNPLMQELLGNEPFFEEFATEIENVYNEMQNK